MNPNDYQGKSKQQIESSERGCLLAFAIAVLLFIIVLIIG